ncbi:hypothetical protein AB0A60_19495 [Streptomyces sp. NPDC046275]
MERVTLDPQGDVEAVPGARGTRVRLDRLRPTSTGNVLVHPATEEQNS